MRSDVGSGTRPRMRHTSVLVPPMSKLTASANPHAAAMSAAARTPPAGPDSNSAAAARAPPATGTSPPAEVITSASGANASSCMRYGAHTGSRNASTTVVTMRSYSRNSGLTSCEHTTSSDRTARNASATARSCRASRSECSRHTAIASMSAADLGQRPVERFDLVRRARRADPTTSKRKCRGTSGDGTIDERVVQRRAHLPRDLDLVDESPRRDQRNARAAPFEQRVRRDRRAVREHVDTVAPVDRRRSPVRRRGRDRRASTRPSRRARRRRRHR